MDVAIDSRYILPDDFVESGCVSSVMDKNTLCLKDD